MTRALLLLPLVALAAGPAPAKHHTRNPTVESVHQPVVRRTDYVFDVPAGGLATADRTRLDGWLQSLHLAYGDRVSVDGDPTTRNDVRGVVGRYGLLLEPTAPITEGALAPGFARVIVSRTVADVPGCPDWSRPSQPEFQASTTSNYGCGVNKTFAAMLANPEDLVNPREADGAIDPRLAARAIGTYRSKTPTGAGELKAESSKGGN